MIILKIIVNSNAYNNNDNNANNNSDTNSKKHNVWDACLDM